MGGRRSSDYHEVLGYPQDIPKFQLPTQIQVVNFGHFLKKTNISTGVWNHAVTNEAIAIAVTDEIEAIWNKTQIPTQCSYMKTYVIQKVKKLLDQCKTLKITERKKTKKIS